MLCDWERGPDQVSEMVVFEQKPYLREGPNHADVWGKRIPGRGTGCAEKTFEGFKEGHDMISLMFQKVLPGCCTEKGYRQGGGEAAAVIQARDDWFKPGNSNGDGSNGLTWNVV